MQNLDKLRKKEDDTKIRFIKLYPALCKILHIGGKNFSQFLTTFCHLLDILLNLG